MTTPLRAVLLDAIGTVLEARPPVVDVYCRTAGEAYGLDVQPKAVATRLRRAIAECLRANEPTSEDREYEFWKSVVAATFPQAPDRGELAFQSLWQHFADPAQWRVLEDVTEAWNSWQAAGYLVGIASNFDHRLETLCRHLPPLDRACRVFTSANVGYRKPHPEFFRRIERSLGLPSQACALVGDQLDTDVLGAHQAGWRAVWVDRSPTTGRSATELPDLPEAVGRVSSLIQAAQMLSPR